MRYGKMASLLVCFLVLLWMGGCASHQKSPDGILSELCSACETLPAGEIYRSGAAEGEDGFLSSAMTRAMYGEDAEELLGSCSFAIYQSSFAEPYEIAVFRAESRTDAGRLAELCLWRSDELRVALRETDFDPLGEEIRIVRKGKYVVMGITSDGDRFAKQARKEIS